jgi:hypothetical protein
MFQNDPTLINLNSIPDGLTVQDTLSMMKSSAIMPLAMNGSVDTRTSITELKADTIFENLGDILALEMIDGKQYFRLKAMLHSSDFETANMARNIVFKHFQQV